ncbi:hypothetical protein B0I35DRAFT_434308 [Stachybotrys elegans]|uniref:Uncharacterized protein n=1 Tax=Stachybotrys elegans TaxID=80388 RepID=A0A8K0SV81_9HYPO|nr:hypothetical protein B0I35DRAFT_434308 [Stachybotrys elegans]
MDACSPDGNADLYGLGIRLGFYLQWFSSILANALLVEEEILATRFALFIFMSATFVTLIVQTIREALTIIDTYTVLLLCFGYHYFLIPTFLWRVLTCFNHKLDPTRWILLAYSPTFYVFFVILLAATSGFQLWFWISEIPNFPTTCASYGFLFSKVSLQGEALRATNITLQVLLILVYSLGLFQYIIQKSKKTAGTQIITASRKVGETFQLLRSTITGMVAIIIIIATELTLSWNDVQGVDELDSAGQLIPFFIVIAVLLHVLWAYYHSSARGDLRNFVIQNPTAVMIPAARSPGSLQTPARPQAGAGIT